MEGITRIVRITNSRRLADRVLIVQIKEPDEPILEKLGKLFAIVEIESPLSENRQIAQTIINTLSRNYFTEKAKDPSEQFEKAIKHVNKELYKITKSGDSDWLGKINAILGLTIDDAIHLSSTGKVSAWAIRNQTDSPILDGDDHTHSPEKTFSHIISGSLESKDILLFASSGLLDLVSPSTLKGNVFGSEDLLTASMRFGQILRAKKGFWVNGILLDFHSFKDASEIATIKIPETIYLDSGSNFDLKILTASTVKATSKSSKRVGYVLKGWSSEFKTFVDKSVIPANKKVFSSLKSFAISSGQTIKQSATDAQAKIKDLQKAKAISAKTQVAPSAPIEPITPPVGKAIDGVSGASEGASLIGKNLITNAPLNPTNKPAKNASLKFSMPKPSIKINLEFFKNKIQDVNFLWKSLAVLLIGLLIFSLSSTILNSEKNTHNAQLASEINALSNKLDEASLAIAMSQKELANTTLEEILQKAPEFLETEYNDQAQEIVDRAESMIEELNGITRVELGNPLFEISDGKTISVAGELIFASSGSEIAKYNQTTSESNKSDFSNSILSSTFYGDNSFLAYENNQVYIVSDSLDVKKPTTPDNWEQGLAIASFGANVYILSPSDNQIWRYASSGDNFGGKTEYIQDDSIISDSIDLAIDGSIYALKSTGEVVKFFQGVGEPLNLVGLSGQPELKLSNVSAIITSANHTNLYILADNKIYVFSKDGALIKTLRSPANVIDFAVSDDEKSVFILSDGKVFGVNL